MNRSEVARAESTRPATTQALVGVSLATLLASIVFVFVPAIDIAVANAFFVPGAGFPMSQEPTLRWLRWCGRAIPTLAIGALVIAVAIRFVRRRPWASVSDAALGYVLAVFALGPLLLSNLVFKATWGRPRPSQTDLFSGNLEFTPAWQVYGQCGWNCSFVSGEASMSIALVALTFLLPKRQRPSAIVGVCVWTAIISWNRMAFGAHYLSDVVLAAAMTAMIALALKIIMIDGATVRTVASGRGLQTA